MDPRFSGSHQDTDLHDPSDRPALGPADQLQEIPEKTPGWIGPVIAGLLAPILSALIAFPMISIAMLIFTHAAVNVAPGVALRAFLATGPGFFIVIVATEVGLALVAIVAAAWSPLEWRARLGLVRPRCTGMHLLLFVVASVGITTASWLLTTVLEQASLLPPIGAARMAMGQILMGIPKQWIIPVTLAATILPGVCEELLYRGFVQGGLIRRWTPWLAIGVSSVLFSAGHGDFTYALFSIPIGVWLGVIAWKSGSVLPGMLCHACVNATFQIVGRLTAPSDVLQKATLKPNEIAITLAALVLFFLPVTVLAVRALRRLAPAVVPATAPDPPQQADPTESA